MKGRTNTYIKDNVGVRPNRHKLSFNKFRLDIRKCPVIRNMDPGIDFL